MVFRHVIQHWTNVRTKNIHKSILLITKKIVEQYLDFLIQVLTAYKPLPGNVNGARHNH